MLARVLAMALCHVVEFSYKLAMPSSSHSRPIVYHSNHQALSTARIRRAALLATADTCTLIS